MTKSHSPLLGFNNNVRHRGRLFHIQTEDSGVRHPHVITHLFMDGGRILKSIKTSYADHVANERLSEVVRDLMKEQHKAMFIALRAGHFDRVIDGDEPSRSGPPISALPKPIGPSGNPLPSTHASDMPALERLLASDRAAAAPVQISDRAPDGDAQAASVEPGANDESSQVAAATTSSRVLSRREAPELFGSEPPDVANVTTRETTTSSSPPKNPQTGERPSSGRYAASRPAAMFASGRAPEDGGSLFGDDLINEKSLDEVILSYLSEDLEPKGEKK